MVWTQSSGKISKIGETVELRRVSALEHSLFVFCICEDYLVDHGKDRGKGEYVWREWGDKEREGVVTRGSYYLVNPLPSHSIHCTRVGLRAQ